MNWLVLAEQIAVVVVVAIVVVVAWMVARTRWLARNGGLFECRLAPDARPGAVSRGAWRSGFARYQDDALQWFRMFSCSLRPVRTFNRLATVVESQREPDEQEAPQLFASDRVVELRTDQGISKLALSADSLTGLLSWLEAAPPGARQWSDGQ